VKLKVKSKTSKKGISFVFTLVFTALLFNSQLNTAVSNSAIKQQIEVLVRLMSVVNHHLIPNSAVKCSAQTPWKRPSVVRTSMTG